MHLCLLSLSLLLPARPLVPAGRCCVALRAPPPPLSFDDGARMKRADLPSEEELSAASFLGGAAGAFVWRHLFGGSALLGALIGVMLARWVAHQPTKSGAYVREAGFITHKKYVAAKARGKAAAEWMCAEAHQLGVPPVADIVKWTSEMLKKVPHPPARSIFASLALSAHCAHSLANVRSFAQAHGFLAQALNDAKDFDDSHRLSERVGTKLRPVIAPLRSSLDWMRRGWASPSLQRQIANTGIPDAVHRFRQRAEERQRGEARRQANGAS